MRKTSFFPFNSRAAGVIKESVYPTCMSKRFRSLDLRDRQGYAIF